METGLYHFRNRYLDPSLARFISRDPIGVWGDEANLGNPLAYVGGRPWTHTDPMGLATTLHGATYTEQGTSGRLGGTGYHYGTRGTWQITYRENWFGPDEYVRSEFVPENPILSNATQTPTAGAFYNGASGVAEGVGTGVTVAAIAVMMLTPDPSDLLVVGALGALSKAATAVWRTARELLDDVAEGIGRYGDKRGHHIHSKAAFNCDKNYDPRDALSLSKDFMKKYGINHEDVTAAQRSLYKELAESGRTVTMAEQNRIAEQALVAGGAPQDLAKAIVSLSSNNLANRGVTKSRAWGQ